MPELPEVQTIVNDLNDLKIVGQKIKGVKVFWPRTVFEAPLRYIKKEMVGKRIEGIKRRGKVIIFSFDDGHNALLHLRMSGRLLYVPKNEKRDQHERLAILFENGHELRLHDTRKFARFYIGKYRENILESLGKDPFDPEFTQQVVQNIVQQHNRMLKALLLDQSVIAGIGNIYADEILWRAKLHPQSQCSLLSQKESKELYRSITEVLRQSIQNRGTSLGDGQHNYQTVRKKRGRNQRELKVYGRAKQKCARCRSMIQRMKVAQRGTYFCPTCQKIKQQFSRLLDFQKLS